MQHVKWLALAGFFTILVNAEITEKSGQQDNSHGTDPTRHYNTIIDENTRFDALIASPSTPLNLLKLSTDENRLSTLSDNLIDNNRPTDQLPVSQVIYADKSKFENFIDAKFNKAVSGKFHETSIESTTTSNNHLAPNYSNLDRKSLVKEKEKVSTTTTTFPISRKPWRVKVYDKNLPMETSTQSTFFYRFSTSLKHFQLSEKMSNTQRNETSQENNGNSGKKEMVNYVTTAVPEKNEQSDVIKYGNNVQGDILQMKLAITPLQSRQENQLFRNTMVITRDVNISHGVSLKSPAELRNTLLPFGYKKNSLDSRSTEKLLTHADSTNNTEKLLNLYLKKNINENHTIITASNDIKYPSINDSYVRTIHKLSHKWKKNAEKSIIQSKNKTAIKNGLGKRELKRHHDNTTKITMAVREVVEKTITSLASSENHKFSTISTVPLRKMLVQDFSSTDIKNELVSTADTIGAFDSESPRSNTMAELTQQIDTTYPSAVGKIDSNENLQSYNIKSNPLSFVTGNPLDFSTTNNPWDYTRNFQLKNKVPVMRSSSIDAGLSMENLHSTFGINSQDLIYSPTLSSNDSPDIMDNHHTKSLGSLRALDNVKSLNPMIDFGAKKATLSQQENENSYSINGNTSMGMLLGELDGQTGAVIYGEYRLTSAPELVEVTDSVLSVTTMENPSVTIQSDKHSLDDSEAENSSRASLNQWPVKHSAVVEGDLVLGGLMMVHEREESVTCGPVMPQGGVQALEAMLYTLDWLNQRGIVPGVKIGAHILDDCDKDTYGLEMAVDFIKGSISNIDGAEYHCNKTAVRKVISGVVGAASSVTSIQVANLLRLFRIPQVSFFSTSPELSNKQRFEYFTRTIPSDHYQVKAMVDIVLKMGWSYISIIYEESNYGIKAYEELEELLARHQICIAIKEKLVKDSGVADETAYDSIVQKLLTKPRAKGCIIFGSDQEVAGVMRAVRRCNATGAFSWIGSDGWSARGLVSDNNEPEVEGTLSVQPQANPVEGFEDYFLNLTVENNRRNPWFVEFWEDHFQCRYPNSSRTPYNQKYTRPCTTTERLTKQNTAFEDQLQFVSDAVLAFAYAFRDMHADLCHGTFGLCDAMKPTKGTELLKYLRKVEFEGLTGDKFHFDKNGDGPARYNIIHFKQVSPGQYKWIRVGQYLEGELSLNMSEIQFRLGKPQPPESVCSLPCRVGQAKKYVEGESCCWHCLDCTQYQIRDAEDQTRCVLCRQGTVPDETHSFCKDIPEEFLKPDSGWAIGAMSFSASGILVTLFVGGVFVKHNDTPIVRASGRELSYVLLTGILLCYLVTFTLVLKPTDVVCGMQRFAAGFCFTVVYAALLTKTNRIARIFKASSKSAKRPSFISPRSQLIICSLLVGVQILINAVWMVIDPAKARHHYPTREDNLLVCNSYIDASYMIAFTYPIILIVVCTVYAVLTRKIPEDFNESKHIGFTMYTTCVIWLAFVPLYFGTGNHVALRITSMSVTISLSASVTIACLFSPKLYIILIHPERNIRRGMGPFRATTPKSTNLPGARNNTSSMMATVTLTAVTCDQNKAVDRLVVTTNDCSTQSERFEMDIMERKNGKPPATMVNRSTQTLINNNGKEMDIVMSPVIKQLNIDETLDTVKSINNAKIGNGPYNKNQLPS